MHSDENGISLLTSKTHVLTMNQTMNAVSHYKQSQFVTSDVLPNSRHRAEAQVRAPVYTRTCIPPYTYTEKTLFDIKLVIIRMLATTTTWGGSKRHSKKLNLGT